MPPGVCDTPAATPALPRWPVPTGQLTATPEPSVTRAEVDGAGCDRGNAASGPDRAVLKLVPERRAHGGYPLRDERRDERAAGAAERRAGRPRRRCAGRRGSGDGEQRRDGGEGKNSGRSADLRHGVLSSFGVRGQGTALPR